MILPLHRSGGSVDITQLSATHDDVFSGDIFIGAGSDKPQEGSIINRGSPVYNMGINETIVVPKGNYNGGKVQQNIEVMDVKSIGPGGKQIIIPTAGKYMANNIVIRGCKNLSTSVIKKNEYVGGVGPGIFEGYVNTDPKVPYYYGTFNGIQQTVTAFSYKYYDHVGEFSLQKDHMEAYVKNNNYYTAVVFNQPINLTGLRKIIVRVEHNVSARFEAVIYRNKVTNYIYDNASSTNLKLNPNLGEFLGGASMHGGSGGDISANINVSGMAYIYLMFIEPGTVQTGARSKVYIVKFE